MPKYLIKIVDKATGAECMKEYKGRDRCAAQDRAIEDDWMLAEPRASHAPKEKIPTFTVPQNQPLSAPQPYWWTRFWNAEDPQERAVIRGICKAYCLILVNTFLVLVLIAVAVGFVLAMRTAM